MERVAIVTGGSRGAGRAAALRLGRRGYAVVVGYARDRRAADAAVDDILAAGGLAVAIRADVTDELDVERLFAETIEAFGGVDLVVHAAPTPRTLVDAHAARYLRAPGAVRRPDTARTPTGAAATAPRPPRRACARHTPRGGRA
jgi:NAD(P)-dependent dehydrogenase (short-subunit alcohol dehydrogenase family)